MLQSRFRVLEVLVLWLVVFCSLSVFAEDGPDIRISEDSQVVLMGDTVNFTAEFEDDEEAPQLQWFVNDQAAGDGEFLSHTFNEVGVYTVSLAAEDDDGTATTFSRYVFVNRSEFESGNHEPMASIEEPFLGTVVEEGTDVSFYASSYDYDGDEVTLYWDFGDGELGTGKEVCKVFYAQYIENEDTNSLQVDPYAVTLWARDSQGVTRWDYDLTLVAVYDDQPPIDGEIKEPIPEAPEAGEFDFELVDEVELSPGEILHFRGGLKGSDDTANLHGIWKVFKLGNDEEVCIWREGLETDIAYADFEEDGEYVVLFFLLDTITGLIDPIPAIMSLEVEVPQPDLVEIIEPAWDDYFELGEGVDLAASANDYDGTEPLTWNWTVTNLQDSSVRTFTGARLDHVEFPNKGAYRIQLVAEAYGVQTPAFETRYIYMYDEEQLDQIYGGGISEASRVEPATEIFRTAKDQYVTITASGQAPEGHAIESYLWEIAGQDPVIGGPSITHVFREPGYVPVKAFPKDDRGLYGDPALWFFYIFEDNMPPESIITKPALNDAADDDLARAVYVMAGGSVSFEGTIKDYDGGNPKPEWEVFRFVEDDEGFGDEEIMESEELNPTFTFEEPGVYVVIFAAEDEEGDDDPFGDIRLVFVLDGTTVPETYLMEPAENLVVEPGEPLYFFGFGEHPSFLPLTYIWDFASATYPDGELDTDVYPVIFDTPSPEGEPYVVSVRARAEIVVNGETLVLEDPTPATIQITVKRFEDSEFEPNNAIEEAALVQLGSYSSLALDDAGGDTADYFRFNVEEAEKDLRLSLGGSAGDLSLNLYRLEGESWIPWEAGAVAGDEGRGSVTLENVPVGSYAAEILPTENGKRKKRSLSYSFNVGVLEPALYLPFMVEDVNFSSSIGIINTGGDTADLAIQGINPRGEVIACETRELKANGRLYLSGSTLFGKQNGKEVARDIAWVKVSSNRRLVGYTNAMTQDKTQLSSVGAIHSLAPAALVPHVAQVTDTWYTRAVVVNVDKDNQEVSFIAPEGEQNFRQTPMAKGEQDDLRFTKIYPGDLPGWGRFKNKNNEATIAGFEMFGRSDGFKQVAGLEMIDVRDKNASFVQVNRNIYFTHVANPDIFWTGLSLINTDSRAATFNLVAYNSQGEVTARKDNQTLPVGGKLLTTSALMFEGVTDVAWIAVETGFEMAGFELFGDADGKILSGFGASRFLSDRIYFGHIQETTDWYTGLAMLNVSPNPVEIEITLYSDDGEVLLTKRETLEAYRKLVRLAAVIFDTELPSNDSYICVKTVDESRVLAGFELIGTKVPGGFGELLGGLKALKN